MAGHRFFLLAGEASGDLHAANLAREIKQQQPNAIIKAWGGDQLKNADVTVLKHYKDFSVMGFVEVVLQLPKIFKLLQEATQQIIAFNPDVVVLIDFSGFNLRLAKRLKQAGYTGKIVYYISPKLWVWNKRRVNTVKKYIDAMLCILPFEVDFYQSMGYSHAKYVGNPLMDELSRFSKESSFLEQNQLENKKIVAILPGSRAQEIQHILPTILEVTNKFPNHTFVIAGVKHLQNEIEELCSQLPNPVQIIYDKTYQLVAHAEAAIVTSGTATLETALLNTPLVLVYKANAISYFIAKRLVSIPFIGLPNLIVEQEMIRELIQKKCTPMELSKELNRLLFEDDYRSIFFKNQELLQQKVGERGASKRAANYVLNMALSDK